jgi:hypothetical protein
MSIKLHAGQSTVFKDLFIDRNCRYSVVCCSRGWGKSYLAAVAATTAVFELLELPYEVPNKNVYIIAPTYDQVTDIYYPLLNYELGLERYALRSSREHGRFLFSKNVELRLVSYEAIERMRGKGAYFVVGDELSSWYKKIHPKDAWQAIIQPTLTTRWSPQSAARWGAASPGRALLISTPSGYNFFYDVYNYQELDPEWKSYHYDYTQSPFLDPDEIEKVKHTIDPIKFASEYLASFKDSGMNVFYCFDRKLHLKKDLPYFQEATNGQKGEDVHVCIDFNVGLQCSSFFALRGNQMHFLDEFKGHPDTETLAKAIREKFPKEKYKVHAYPDPSGKARKTSAPVGVTDFSILQAHGIQIHARDKAPPIVDSVNAVNRKLLTAAGDIDMYIHPRCVGLTASLERTKWVDKNPDTATIDKDEGVEHFSDGVRYGVEYLFPVRNRQLITKRGFAF